MKEVNNRTVKREPTKPTVKNNITTTCFILYCLREAGDGCRRYGRHTRNTLCYIKSFYGRLSGILNYFDRGKTVTFSDLVREICYGVGRNAP